MNELEKKIQDTIWAAKSLFERGKTAGSSANISFRHEDRVYISGSGTCFGRLRPEDFSVTDMEGNLIWGLRPSKELPLHLALYRKSEDIGGVVHTHIFYTTLWSCLHHENPDDIIPHITPYLEMKVGKIALVPYAPPGSKELFAHMDERIGSGDGFVLKNHGPIIGGKTIMDAFYGIEELEESAKMAWYLRKEPDDVYDRIGK